MQRAGVVSAQLPNDFDDAVGGALIVFLAADVIQRITCSIAEHRDVLRRELDLRQVIVGAQPVEPAAFGVQECALGVPRPFFRRDEPDLRRFQEPLRRVRVDGQREQGFGDDLRRESRDSDQDSARIIVRHHGR